MSSADERRQLTTAETASPRFSRANWGGVGQFRELVLHLTGRQLSSLHRFTLLGWAWPLARQLAQLGVLVLIFDSVLHVQSGIHHFAVFVFVGLIAWNWFSGGVSGATTSIVGQRHFVFQPRLSTLLLPVVAVAVAFTDVLLALPVLIVMLIVTGTLQATIVALPALLLIQLVLQCGVGWLTAAANVYLRDVQNIVAVLLTIAFYVTPVFYSVAGLHTRARHLLELNPLTTLLESYRAVVMGTDFPDPGRLAIVAVVSALVAAAGYLVFRRLEPGFVDEL